MHGPHLQHCRAAQPGHQQDRQPQPDPPPLPRPSAAGSVFFSRHTPPMRSLYAARAAEVTPPRTLTMALKALPRSMKLPELVKGSTGRGEDHHVPGNSPVTGGLYSPLKGRHIQYFRMARPVIREPAPRQRGSFRRWRRRAPAASHAPLTSGPSTSIGDALVLAPGDEDDLLCKGSQARDGAGGTGGDGVVVQPDAVTGPHQLDAVLHAVEGPGKGRGWSRRAPGPPRRRWRPCSSPRCGRRAGGCPPWS